MDAPGIFGPPTRGARWRRVAAATLLLAAAGCSRRETPVAAGVRTQTLLLGNYAEPADLDPQVIVAYTDMNIINALFEGLTWIDPKTSQPVPAAAERWEVSADGMRYTFHLRAGACWSNGDPLTADDFVFSFHRILTPGFASSYSYMLWPIKNAEAFNNGKIVDFSLVGAKALDDRTLRVDLERPTPYLPALAAHTTWMPVPRKVIETFGAMAEKGTGWTRPGHLIGNGPFVLQEWTPNSRIVVVKNSRYWNAAHCRLSRIEFYPTDNPEAEELAFRAGQLDVTYTLPAAKIASYRAAVPSLLRIEPLLYTIYIGINTARAPFDRLALRRALSLAIDRDAIARDVFAGSVPPAHSLTPPNCGGYVPPSDLSCDPVEARRLLAEAGFPGGRGLPAIELLSFTDSNIRRAMEAIQAMWLRELGVHATLLPQENKTLFQNQQDRNYTIGACGWVADYADPFTFLGIMTTGNGNNWTGWSNPEYDRLLGEASETVDQARRFALFHQAEEILLREAPMLPIYFSPTVHAVQPVVHGWRTNELGFQRFQDAWLGED
jgi:oligopeptide transport system substrate-binding protein